MIDGAITVELDYSTIQPRILYATAGAEPPEDSYILPGWGEDLRPVTKKLFSQLLNSDETSRNPRQWHRFALDRNCLYDGIELLIGRGAEGRSRLGRDRTGCGEKPDHGFDCERSRCRFPMLATFDQ